MSWIAAAVTVGSVVYGAVSASDEKPALPEWKGIDIGDQVGRSTALNREQLPNLEKLAKSVNDFQITEFNKNLEKMMPGATGVRDASTGVIKSWVMGERTDAQDADLSRLAAEKGRASGTSGSDFSFFREARDSQRDIEARQMRGVGAASSWLAAAASRTPNFDVTSMFVNWKDLYNAEASERNAQFNYNLGEGAYNAAPTQRDTYISGLAQGGAQIGMSSFLKSYNGGGGFGGGTDASINSSVNGMKPMSAWG